MTESLILLQEAYSEVGIKDRLGWRKSEILKRVLNDPTDVVARREIGCCLWLISTWSRSHRNSLYTCYSYCCLRNLCVNVLQRCVSCL